MWVSVIDFTCKIIIFRNNYRRPYFIPHTIPIGGVDVYSIRTQDSWSPELKDSYVEKMLKKIFKMLKKF